MAKIIAKFGYLKGGSRGGYTKYIATREGVEKLNESLRDLPVTQNQQEFIQKLLMDFPDSKDLLEYEDYQKSPTLGSASEFISQAIELHMGELSGRSGYLKYMGTRPRVEKQGSHGLFSYAGEPISLSEVAQEVDTHRGNIWTAIYSLRREDAQRLGYDTAARWRDLLRSQAITLAEGLKIPPTHLKWYAAFHNEGHHPHVHLIAYSTKPGEGFLTKQGMGIIRSALAQEIFRQDLISVYQQQTAHRDELRRVSREKVAGLVEEINRGGCDNPQVEQLLRELAKRLSQVKGKKVYGYLRPELKSLVNQIVDELAKDERIAQLYDLWYQDKQAARNVYDERPLQRVPLSENSDFKPIRNAVVQAAIVLPPAPLSPAEDEVEPGISEPSPSEDDEPVESPPVFFRSRGKKKAFWTEEYLEARRAMYGGQASPPDLPLAVRLMKELADENPLAAHDLGVLLLKGMGCQADGDEAQRWFQKALSGFQQAASTEKKTAYFQYRVGKMHAMGYGVEQDYLEAALWYERAVQHNNYPFAAYALGTLYLRGQGVERDEERALELFLTAAEHENQANAYAMYELGKMYRRGIGTEIDETKANYWDKMAYNAFVSIEKARPDDRLQYRLGYMALHGIGTDPSPETAYFYWKRAVKQHNKDALYALGKLCLDPAFPGFSPQEGEYYLWESWEKHQNLQAAYLLGKSYAQGTVLPQNMEKALELLATVAEKGNPYAQYLLGKIYYWGNGVEQDREKGLEYIRQAAEQGHPGAVRFLEHLAQGEQDAYAASLFPMATRLLLQVGQIFGRQFNLNPPVARLVDAKLRRKIAEKKLAHGQKLEM